MKENETLGFICSWGGLGAADLAGVKGLSYSRGVYLIPVNCLGSIDPTIFSMAFVNGVNSILLAGCTPTASCHYLYGVDHCWYRVNVMKKLLSLAGLERRRITMGYVDVNQPEAFVRMVESHVDGHGEIAPHQPGRINQNQTLGHPCHAPPAPGALGLGDVSEKAHREGFPRRAGQRRGRG